MRFTNMRRIKSQYGFFHDRTTILGGNLEEVKRKGEATARINHIHINGFNIFSLEVT